MESKTDLTLIHLYIYTSRSSNPDRKTVCKECIKATQSHLNKMAAGLESKTFIPDPPVHLGVEDVKLCKPGRKITCEVAQSQDENKSDVQRNPTQFPTEKMALHLVEKHNSLSYKCQKCGLLVVMHNLIASRKSENSLMRSKTQIQSQLK